MKFFPSPDGVLNWRFCKQFLAFSVFCVTMLIVPILFNIPTETILFVIGEHAIFTINDFLIPFCMNKVVDLFQCLKGDLNSIMCELFLITTHLYMTYHFGSLFLPERGDDDLPILEIQFALATMGRWCTKLLYSILNLLLPVFLPGDENHKKFNSKKENKTISWDDEIRSQVQNLGKKAGLQSSISTEILHSSEMQASASSGDDYRVIVYQGLIDRLKTRENINAVLAHEVSHLKRSFLDEMIIKGHSYLSPILQAFGKVLLFSSEIPFTSNLALMAMINVTSNIISHSEEERADRMACHLVENPDAVRSGLACFFKKRGTLNQKPSSKFASVCDDMKEYTTMLFGYSTHPRATTRLKAIEDELTKIRKRSL